MRRVELVFVLTLLAVCLVSGCGTVGKVSEVLSEYGELAYDPAANVTILMTSEFYKHAGRLPKTAKEFTDFLRTQDLFLEEKEVENYEYNPLEKLKMINTVEAIVRISPTGHRAGVEVRLRVKNVEELWIFQVYPPDEKAKWGYADIVQGNSILRQDKYHGWIPPRGPL